MLRAMPPTPLILDVDTGVDDALALLYAAASPEVELIAATAVMGNVTVDRATRNTLALLELVGSTDVEVARGAERPLVRKHEPFPVVHGATGLGRAELPEPGGAASSRSAAQLIVDEARGRPGAVLLVATGPLTNIATALALEPNLPGLLRGFALMGGAYARGGNTTPAAEANIWVDPDAARDVFHAFSGAPTLPICVGLDVTESVAITRDDLDGVCTPAPGAPVARFLSDAVPFYIEFYERTRGFGGACMHDPLALAVAMDETLAELRATRVEVECDGAWTRGMTVTDLGGIRHSPWPVGWEIEENARVALGVDADAFMTRFLGRLRSLVERQA
jgi:purine nucleosidase